MEVSSSPFCEVVEVPFPVGGIFCLPPGGLSSSSVFVSPAVDIGSGRFAWVIPWRADADLVLRCCCLWMVVGLASPSYGVRRGSCGIFQRLAPLVRAVVEVFPVLDVFSGGGDWTLEFTVATVRTFASILIFSRVLCVSFGPCRMCFVVCVFSSFFRGLFVKGTS